MEFNVELLIQTLNKIAIARPPLLWGGTGGEA